MPQSQNEHVAAFHEERVTHNIAGRAERDHDLTNAGISGWTAESGKFLDAL